MCYVSSNVAEGKEEGECRRKTDFSDHNYGEECVSARICTKSSNREHKDKSFSISQDTAKNSSVIFFSVLPSRLYRCPLKTGFPFNIFKCQYCAQIIFNLAAESIPVNRYEWLQFFFPFQQLTILTCKEESFCKILNFYKGKNWQNNNNICLLSGNIDMVLLQQNWFVLWSVSHR